MAKTTEGKADGTPGDGRLLVVAGGSGVVGRHLARQALKAGWRVRWLSRSGGSASDGVEKWVWRPGAAARGEPQAVAQLAAALEGAAALVNLAGSGLGEGRLTASRKTQVLNSRLEAVAALGAGLQAASHPPKVWGQASAVGYYGHQGESPLDESASQGSLFLSHVCAQWERAAAKAAQGAGARLVVGRIGLVLAADAPAWKKLLLPVRLGLGGPLGSGRQWYGWVDADDLARAFLFLLDQPQAQGVYNLTAPQPVRQGELVALAARLLRRPAWVPAPAFVLRLVLGQLADELLLPSCRALPERLSRAGFVFDHPEPGPELERLLKS